jgi:pimeloyl-ACP methyl ester carboxylesterase
VATRLRAAGHLVYAPTLDGCGERHHLVRPGITVGTQAREVAQPAERLKAAWHELDTGHCPMLSEPDELTRLLLT